MRRMKLLPVVLVVLLLLGLVGCSNSAKDDRSSAESTDSTAQAGSGEANELTIAIAGMVTPKEGLDYYLKLSEYVGAKVGRPVRLIHKADYSQVNEMLRTDKVDVAFVCSGPYVAGHDAFDLKLLCAPVVGAEPAYHSYIIVNASSEATSLESLKGARFAYTDPESNTGHTVPRFMVKKLGEDPDTFFSETYFTYSHDNSIRAVATGEADAAAVDSLIWEYAQDMDPTYSSKTRVLIESEPYAIPPVVVRPDLDPALVSALRSAFLGASENEEGQAILRHMRIERFIEIDDSAYDVIRRMNAELADSAE